VALGCGGLWKAECDARKSQASGSSIGVLDETDLAARRHGSQQLDLDGGGS